MSPVCKVKWCSAMAGESGYCGPHRQWPPFEGENADMWTSRAGRESKALKKIIQHAEKITPLMTEKPQAVWEIVMATKITTYHVKRALKHLQEKGAVVREGKSSKTKYKAAPAKAA